MPFMVDLDRWNVKPRDIRCASAKKTLMRVAVRRINCRACGAPSHEPIAFCPYPHVRYTRPGEFRKGA